MDNAPRQVHRSVRLHKSSPRPREAPGFPTWRRDKEELLSHPARRLLYEAICRRPGLPFLQCLALIRADPALALTAGHGMLTHHLTFLQRFHYATSRKEGRYRRYFQNGGRFGRATEQIALLQTPPVDRLARLLLDQPGISQKELWQRLAAQRPLTRQSVAYHLRRLEQRNLVLRVDDGNWARYYPLEAMETANQYIAAGPIPPPAPLQTPTAGLALPPSTAALTPDYPAQAYIAPANGQEARPTIKVAKVES